MTTSHLQSLTIVLTGATEGIGREVALLLAQNGHRLVLAARNSERLDSITEECRSLGATAISVITDVAKAHQCQTLINRTIEQFGGIDALINNAGITMWTYFEEVTDIKIFENLMRVNYHGPVALTHAALPYLKKSQGRIVAISSVAGLTGVPTRTGYAASKHAMFGFFDSLRVELIPHDVSVTVVAPDFVTSEIHYRALTSDGTPLQKKPFKEGSVMSAKECARMTVDAMMKRKRLKILSLRGRALRWLRLLWPSLVDSMTLRAVSKNP